MIFLIGLATVLATFFGGLFAIKFKDKLHLILGFSAGAVIGVAFFDLLPEAMVLGQKSHEISVITSFVALGFVIFMVVDRLVTLHIHIHDEADITQRGRLGASSLSLHSFLDGLAIGLAFKVSISVGFIVAFAVLAHDFSDGINTVSLILKNKGSGKEALKWLILDALAPLIGIAATLFIGVDEQILSLILATFCGFFIYIGASDLLPESHHQHPTIWTSIMTILGIATLYLVIRLASF